jgi:hypothetical protein
LLEGKVMTEKEFIISLAVSAFRQQFNATILPTECDVKSIPKNTTSELGYEVYSTTLVDYLRMRIYLNFGNGDWIGPYTLETDATHVVGNLGDEVFVASGYVNDYYRTNGVYKFPWLSADALTWGMFITESGEPLLMEDGGYLLTESGV